MAEQEFQELTLLGVRAATIEFGMASTMLFFARDCGLLLTGLGVWD
jgi:hypothetical protein